MTPTELKSWLLDAGRSPLVMGVLNVTPDSFSDGARYAEPQDAVRRATELDEAGADLIDVGGESTRPGSKPVPEAEQIRRILPVLEALRGRTSALLSVDTTRAGVAEAALDAGAALVNDISAGRDDPAMLPLVARRRVPVVLMHMQGRPETMQAAPHYSDVTREVIAFLKERLDVAAACGIDPSLTLVDPGIGFGKSAQHNLELLRRMGELSLLGRPIVLGASRKGFIGRITGEAEPARRLFGTAAAVAWGVAHGAAVLRVHDVSPMSQVLRMIRAIQSGSDEPPGKS